MSDWLDPELRELLDDAKPLDDPSPAERDRVMAAVRTRLASAKVAPSTPRLGIKVPAWTLALAFGAGVGVGAIVLGSPATTTPAPLPSAVASASPAPSGVPSPEPTPDATQALAPTVSATAPAPSPSASAPAPPAVDLERERVLLEAAKVALARGDGDAALDAVHDHARRFPSGALAEERDALEIQALVATGARVEASARADRFRVRYPKSMFLPAVEATLGDP